MVEIAYSLVGAPRAATATLASVSEVVGVMMVIPPSTSGTGLRARQVRVCVRVRVRVRVRLRVRVRVSVTL